MENKKRNKICQCKFLTKYITVIRFEKEKLTIISALFNVLKRIEIPFKTSKTLKINFPLLSNNAAFFFG